MRKKTIYIIPLVFLFMFSCKTIKYQPIVDNAYEHSRTEEIARYKVDNSERKISTNYQLEVKSTPTKSNPSTYLKISGTDKYKYDTKIHKRKHLKKKKIVRTLTTVGALSFISGTLMKKSDIGGGGFIRTIGLSFFIGGKLLPKSLSEEVWEPGESKTREKKVIPPANSEVVVKYNNKEKKYKTSYDGRFNFNVVDDFGLIRFKEPQDIDFKVYMQNKHLKVNGWKDAVTLSSLQWTNKYLRITSPDANIVSSSGYFITKPLLGTTFPFKRVSYSGKYEIEVDGNKGYVNKDEASTFYKYGEIDQISIKESVKQYVIARIEKWQEKGEFENMAQYRDRLQTRPQKAQEFTREAMETYSQHHSKEINWDRANIVGKYDPESQLFKINIDNKEDIFLNIPLDSARAFKEYFNSYALINPRFQLAENEDKWELSSLEFFNENDSISYFYSPGFGGYNPLVAFVDSTILTPFVIDINNPNGKKNKTVGFNDGGYNVEYGLPSTAHSDVDNAFAIIIGNKDYKNADEVKYAINDARSIREYVINVLGFKPGNIEYIENANKTDFEYLFGNENNAGRLSELVKPNGTSEVFIFYSGHGAPGSEEDNKGLPYFVPVDARPEKLSITGYSSDLLYTNLAKINAKRKTVVIDACFSGHNVIKNVSSLGIAPKETDIDDPNLVLFTSSSDTEFSTWFDAKQHGLFTYFFLKGIHNKDNSDKNQDGKLSYSELFQFITDENDGLPYVVRRLNGRTQTPKLKGNKLNDAFIEYH